MTTQAAPKYDARELVAASLAADEQSAADAVAGGQVVCNLALVRATIAELTPREWAEVAAYLYALIGRAPVKASAAFQAHRMILGTLAFELRNYAQMAGEPVGLEADLRDAKSRAEEQRIRARIDDQHRARDRYLLDLEVQQGITQGAERAAELERWEALETTHQDTATGSSPDQDDAPSAPAAATSSQADDDYSWL